MCEIINDSLVIVLFYFITTNWIEKTWGHFKEIIIYIIIHLLYNINNKIYFILLFYV
jgi:hypothetical protein